MDMEEDVAAEDKMEEVKIKKKYLYIGILVIIVIAGFFFFSKGPGPVIGGVVTNPDVNSGDVQRITIGIKDYNYYPNTIRVKAGQPVSISLDSSVTGCFRSFTIK